MDTHSIPTDNFGIQDDEIERLSAGLGAAADSAGLLDVAYTEVGSPVGALILAATERGLVRVAFDSTPLDQVLDELAVSVGARLMRAPSRFDIAARQLGEYFSGARREFQLSLDWRLASGFRLEVQRYLPHITYGSTASYAEVAQGVGSPKAVRAVGTACAKNPLPIVVPCHRVVRSDGTLGNYAGGPEAKRELLALEGSR